MGNKTVCALTVYRLCMPRCVLYTSLCLSNTATGTLLSRSLTPDDDVFQHLAYTYASRNPNMTKGDQCKNKRNFPNGIINGYSWYPLQGEHLFPPVAFTGNTRVCQKDLQHTTYSSVRSPSCNITGAVEVTDGLEDAEACPSLSVASSLPKTFIHLFYMLTASRNHAKKDGRHRPRPRVGCI